MSKYRCPCCGWKISLVGVRPDVLAACSNCSQVVQVPGIPPYAIPLCSTESTIDWSNEGNPQECEGVPLLPVDLCIPLRKEHSVWANAVVGLLCIGIAIFFGFTSNLPRALPAQLFNNGLNYGVGILFMMTGVYLLYDGFRKLRRCSRVHLLSTALLPQEAKHLGAPLALHRSRSVPPPVLLFLVGVLLIAAAVLGVILLLRGDIKDSRMVMIALMGGVLGGVAIRTAVSYRRVWLLVYRDGFVVQRGREIGVLWRWEDIQSIHLQKTSKVPVLFAYTLRRKDEETFAFDHRLEYIENQFGVRVQQALCRLHLPHLLSGLRGGEQAGFGSLRISSEGLHHEGGFVPWRQVANLTLDGDQLTIRKWGDDGASWSVPYPAVPNLAVFFALTQQLLRERSNEGNSALSVLAGPCLDSTAIQADISNLQTPPHLTELNGAQADSSTAFRGSITVDAAGEVQER